MTSKERELLLAWVVNEQGRIDEEYREMRSRVRFRQHDINDIVELLLLRQRCDDFQEFALTLIRLLNLDLM